MGISYSGSVYDSAGNVYYIEGKNLKQASADLSKNRIIGVFSGKTTVFSLALRKYKNTERLLVSHVAGNSEDPSVGQSYLFEIRVADVPSLPSAGLTFEELITKYKIVGTGAVAKATTELSTELSSADSASNTTKALGIIYAVSSDLDGNIYIASWSTNSGYGHNKLRQLVQVSDGATKKFTQNNIVNAQIMSLSHAFKMEGSEKKDYLLYSTAGNVSAVDLKQWSVTKDFTKSQIKFGQGGYYRSIAAFNFKDGKDFEFYAGDSTSSKIFRFNSKFEQVESLGREIYAYNRREAGTVKTLDESTPLEAISSVLGHPAGLFTDPATSDVYIADNQNGVVFSLDASGKLRKAAGTRSASASYINGYVSRPTGDFTNGKKILYLSNRVADLINKTEKELYPAKMANGFGWTNSSIAFAKDDAGKGYLFNVRHFQTLNTTEAWHASYTKFIHKVSLNGVDAVSGHESYLGDIMKGNQEAATSPYPVVVNNHDINLKANLQAKVVIDKQKYLFLSGDAFVVNKLGEAQSYVLQKPTSYGVKISFAVLEEGAIRHIFFPNSSGRIGYFTMDLAKIPSAKAESEFISPVKTLCLPGTTLSGALDVAISQGGDLIIADSNKSRVLQYRIRDKNKKLVLQEHGVGVCK